MKYQEFEGGLKDLFHNAEATVDMDALISGIHGAKAPRKNNKWLLFGLFCLLAVAGVIGLNQIITNNHKAAEQGSGGDFSISKTIPAKEEYGTNQEKAQVAHNPTKKDIDHKIDPAINETFSTSNKDIETAEATQLLPEPRTTIGTQKTVDEYSASANTKKYSTTPSKSEMQDNAGNSQNKSNVIAGSNISTLNDILPAATPSKNQNANLIARSVIADMEVLGPTSHQLSFPSDMPSPQQVECPTFKKGMQWHFDIIPEVGFIVPLKTLAINSTEQSESFTMRAADETPLEGLQAGLYGRIRPGNAPYYFKLGVSYTRLSERMNLDVNYTRSDTTIGIISITESQNGDTLTVIRGEIITDTMYSRQSVDHYFLHMIDIPAAIGYSKSIGGGWRIGGELGAQLNIGLSTKGKLLESADSYTDLPATGRFLPNVGLSFFAGVTLEKAISERGAIFVSPRFRYFPKAFTPDSYGIRQEYQFAGLHAGYIHSF